MLVAPKILPNEFAPAYIKVFARFNHPRPRRLREFHLPGALRKWYIGNCSIGDLALIGDIRVRDLLKEHTLQHFLRDFILPNGRHWKAIHDSTHASSPVMLSAREQAFLCPCCVESDIDKFGRSYWHTDHQLPGVYECPTHNGTPLRAVHNWEHLEFWRTPRELNFKSSVQKSWLRWMKNDVVRRYVEIALFMARWEGNLNRHDLVSLFKSRRSELRIVVTTLPYFVMSRSPEGWLENLVAPRNNASTSPAYGLTALCDMVAAPRPRRVFVCAATAVLWPTASEGIAALTALDVTS